MIVYKGITFANYEVFYNYKLGDLNLLSAVKAANELADLANDVPLAPNARPSCAYLEKSYLNSINSPG